MVTVVKTPKIEVVIQTLFIYEVPYSVKIIAVVTCNVIKNFEFRSARPVCRSQAVQQQIYKIAITYLRRANLKTFYYSHDPR